MATLSLPPPETLEIDSSSYFLACFSRSSILRPSQNPSPPPLSVKILSEGSSLPPFPPNFPNSKRIPDTRFVVDGFRSSGAFSVAYFLTHFHSDHYAGLSPNWSRGLIFCSPVTARLCVACLNVLECFLVPIEVGRPVRIDGCEVTLIDANHCPGAVQVLVKVLGSEGREKRYVHTGDMRFSESMLSDPILNEFVGADAVFLDTTYCNPRFVFPSQDESIEYIVKTIERIKDKACGGNDGVGERESVLFLISTYVVGKEKILQEISRRIGCRVFVDSMKMVILDQLGLSGSGEFTVDASESDVHVVRWNELGETWPYFRPNFVNMKKILDERKYSRAVGFVPTGWVFSAKRDDFIVRMKSSCEIHLVPYSEHSSYDELRKYVRFLKPKNVIPTVGMENGKKSNSAYHRDICKHFSGLMDETANKVGFLEAFHFKALNRHENGKTLTNFMNEVGVCSGIDRKLYVQNALANQGEELEHAEGEVQFHVSPEKVEGLSLLGSLSNAQLEVTGKAPECPPSEVQVMVSDTGITDMNAETSIQEVRDCLPGWVTVSQMVNLLSEANGEITEAVSIFYENERELHDQVSQSKTSLMQDGANSASEPLQKLVPDSGLCTTLEPIQTDVTDVFSISSPSQSTKPPLPKLFSPKKRETVGSNRSKKKGRVSTNLKSDKYKQVTITKFFGKTQNNVPQDGGMDCDVIDGCSKNEALHDAATADGGKVSQLVHILDSNITAERATILLEKANGDLNLALDIFYNKSTCLVEDFDGKVGSCRALEKFHMIPSEASPQKEDSCQEKVIHVPILHGSGNKLLEASTSFVSLPPETYLPVEHACWSIGEPAPYLHLARTFELVEHERSRLKTTSMLCNMFRSLLALSPEDVVPSVYLCTNRIAPDYQNVEMNVGSSLVTSAIEEACGTSRSRIREMYNSLGDLGRAIQVLL
ncbi:DNA cross-link repair protein [Nymphaea thermarum]|nr:DNA cross-link repair protein [Nymphaea thermarum]